MRADRLWTVVVVLTLTVGCASNDPPEEHASSRDPLTAKLKAQSQGGVDGGVTVMQAAASQSDPSPTITYTVTTTQTQTATGTMTGTGTKVITITTTGTGTKTTTGTVTRTNSQTSTATKLYSATATVSATFTGTKTGTLTSSGTKTASKTATGTATWPGTFLGTGTATGTKSFTSTLTGTTTLSGTLSITATGTTTKSATKSVTGTAVGSGTKTTTQTYTEKPTVTTTTTATSTSTATTTLTKTGTITVSGTGTTTATAVNVCYGTWPFCDNFESGNAAQWTVRQGSASDLSVVPDGSKVYKQSSSSASVWHITQAGSKWLDQTVEGKLKVTGFSSATAGAYAALFGRYQTTSVGDCAYFLELRGDGKVALGKRVNGVVSTIGTAVPSSIAAGTWYALKLDMMGTSIRGYLNGSLVLTQTDATCEVGAAGVGSLGAAFEADDVRVSAPTTNSCIAGWASSTCDICTGQTQEDGRQCYRFLNCYAQNGCSPDSCGGDDDFCGVHQAGNPANPDDPKWPKLNAWGNAPKVIADHVYKCTGCPGSVKCDIPRKPDYTTCADGNACTNWDYCQNGLCQGAAPSECYPADQCHTAGTCEPATGVCSSPPKPDGTTCTPAGASTPSGVCTSGQCTDIKDVNCANPSLPNGIACDDGNTCTQNDACQAGQCVGTPVSNIPCDDQSACTQGDTCQAGVCRGVDSVVCPEPDQCHNAGVCQPETGTCSNPPKNDGESCTPSGSGPCDGGPECAPQGVCTAGQCTDIRDVKCWNPSFPEGVHCDDGNRCTENDVCKVGECKGVPVSNCPPSYGDGCDGGICPINACYPGDSDALCACEVALLTAKMQECVANCVRSSVNYDIIYHCQSTCRTTQATFKEMVHRQCIADPDRDGVSEPTDQCPDTPPGVHVTSTGCPDGDWDHVVDPKDKCPKTYGAKNVDSDGCVVDTTTCKEGKCGPGVPRCPAGTCCELDEIRIQTIIPPSGLVELVGQFNATRSTSEVCLNDSTAPTAPALTTPSLGITSVKMDLSTGHVGTVMQFVDGKVVGGDEVPLSFQWTAVDDSCRPIRYSIHIEYLHCHSVDGVLDLGRYLNAGWCKWQTYLYKTVTTTQFTVQFPMAKVMWELHEPFKTELGLKPPTTGSYTLLYAPQWIRAKVIAFDANANSSGLRDNQSYYVLYSKGISTSLLQQVPSSPF